MEEPTQPRTDGHDQPGSITDPHTAGASLNDLTTGGIKPPSPVIMKYLEDSPVTDDPPGITPGAVADLPLIHQQWLSCDLAPTKLDDPRLTLILLDGEPFGFDVSTDGGLAEIRTRWQYESNVYDPKTWGRWAIRTGPNALAGTVHQTAGEAVRAALRGWVWPDGWDRNLENLTDRWTPR